MSGATKLMTAGGGGVSLTPASSIASDVTVNVPSQNCTLGIQGPAFSAYQSSGQAISVTTFTKVQLQTEEFDTNNNFDNVTNYRFTPTVAGYYQINGAVGFTGGPITILATIYKNGSEYKRGNYLGSSYTSVVSTLVYLNGSTDYVEFYVYSGSAVTLTTGQNTWFNGCLVRAA